MAMATTQSAIEIIMNIHNVSFEVAKDLILKNPNYQQYKDKLISASIDNNPIIYDKGMVSGAKTIIDR